MIPYWRYVDYTDDGCSLYQCLSCYKQWESRSVPGWTDLEGEYHECWYYCPCCGVRWLGCQRERGDEYGPRRARIQEAQEARRREYWNVCYDDLPQNQAAYWWVVEERSTCVSFSFQHELLAEKKDGWEAKYKAKGGIVPVKRVLEFARSWQESIHDWHRAPKDWVGETRVVKVHDLKAAYPYTHNHLTEIYDV